MDSNEQTKRSELMSRIRGKDTDPEKRLRTALWKTGLRYRIHFKIPFARPDIVFLKRKVAVFIDGCFWHGCPLHYVFPRSKQGFWSKKLLDNVNRDQKQTRLLVANGWTVIRFWEHEIYEELEKSVQIVTDTLASPVPVIKASWRVKSVTVPNHDQEIEQRHLVTLNDPEDTKTDVRIRNTKKWNRPKYLYGGRK